MKYIQIQDYKKTNEIYTLWNKAYGCIFPISEDLFQRNISNIYQNGSYVVLNDEDKMIGFILTQHRHSLEGYAPDTDAGTGFQSEDTNGKPPMVCSVP